MISLIKMLMVDEGLRYHKYKDTKGKTTVGIGFNMDDPHAAGTWIKADIPESYRQVYAGTQSMSPESVSKLFTVCINSCKTDLQSIFPEFNTYPEYVQLALINMMFNMGKPTFSEFTTFIKLIKENDYDGASNDLSSTKWARELPDREKRISALLKGDDSTYIAYSSLTSSDIT